MSNAGIPLRIIQEISGHRTLDELYKYLEVEEAQVIGAVNSLSMLSATGVGELSLDKSTFNEPVLDPPLGDPCDISLNDLSKNNRQ
jgi:integrase/recombinase XerD